MTRPTVPNAAPSDEEHIATLEAGASADAVARLFKALGNRHRVAIIAFLTEGECSVGKLGRRMGISQSALSQHLARLRRDRLVRTRREAQTIYYALDDETPQRLHEALDSVLGQRLERDGTASRERT